jgi:hypothetical protein
MQIPDLVVKGAGAHGASTNAASQPRGETCVSSALSLRAADQRCSSNCSRRRLRASPALRA